ncbi:MAG: hypothetical protein OEW39_02575 [Deltaproteobacteria bacterium]|nr:hypothetical protein [Deltaproteobacteria bacterium]
MLYPMANWLPVTLVGAGCFVWLRMDARAVRAEAEPMGREELG